MAETVHERARQIVHSRPFSIVITAFILLAAIQVALDTTPGFRERQGVLVTTIDAVIVIVFVVEISLRYAAYDGPALRFFKSPWNTYDTLLAVGGVIPIASGAVSILRLVRLLRVMRLVRTMPKLRLLLVTTMRSIPSILSISVLMALLFYCYAAAGVFLFSNNDPIHFRDLGTSALSLFRVITLEDWTDIMYTQIYGCDSYGYADFPELCTDSHDFGPAGALFFLSFVFLGTWIVLNLFIGIILTGMDEARREIDGDDGKGTPAEARTNDSLFSLSWVSPSNNTRDLRGAVTLAEPDPAEELERIEQAVRALRKQLDRTGNGTNGSANGVHGLVVGGHTTTPSTRAAVGGHTTNPSRKR